MKKQKLFIQTKGNSSNLGGKNNNGRVYDH